MAMRSQVYEWCNIGDNGQRVAGDNAVGTIPQNVPVDIFTGGIGNNIAKHPEVSAHQFVVIENISCTPQALGTVQLIIDTTHFFQNPDMSGQSGVLGMVSPYPIGAENNANIINPDSGDPLFSAIYPSFTFDPPAYVLPGQTWVITFRPQNRAVTNTHGVVAFVKYTLYDGADSLIANKLLEMSISVTPDNVDWYRRTLIEQNNVLHYKNPNL